VCCGGSRWQMSESSGLRFIDLFSDSFICSTSSFICSSNSLIASLRTPAHASTAFTPLLQTTQPRCFALTCSVFLLFAMSLSLLASVILCCE